MWQQNAEVLECQGQGMASSCGLWEASEKLEAGDTVIFVVLYQGQPGLMVVAGLAGGWQQGDPRGQLDKAEGNEAGAQVAMSQEIYKRWTWGPDRMWA